MSLEETPQSFRAHFDGRNIVPDEPIEIPAMTQLIVVVQGAVSATRTTQERMKALDAWIGHLDLPPVSPDAFDRGSLYRDAI